MGFELKPREWEGPIAHEFCLHSEHTKTARYSCQLKKHSFDFYAPLFKLLGLNSNELPERLQVVIWKSKSPLRTIGYLSEPLPLRIESDVLEYEFTESKVNSKRYDLPFEQQLYALYIPNEVFGDAPHPRRVYVQMGVVDKK
ncbi:MAG: hypothetical protein PHR43_00995 [Dehalococcoidales bacterium]|nr:hypothetical protein [Dehalococcoidales bacterium]